MIKLIINGQTDLINSYNPNKKEMFEIIEEVSDLLGKYPKVEKELPETSCPLKLKTLKDLRPIYSHSPLFKNIELCSKFELKQEAIKWAKFSRKKNILIREIDWFSFFNITEEDLI